MADLYIKADINQMERIADNLGAIGFWIKHLGNGDAATSMGAIENHAVAVREGLADVADAIRGLASAIRGDD